MSTLKTNNIQHVDRSDPSIVINTDGSVSIAGTATYEDVTSIDAVGIITGRSLINAQKQVHVGTGVSVKAGGINVTAGITTVQALQATTGTFSGDITANGNIAGDNSTNITGVNQVTIGDLYISENIVHRGDDNTRIRFPAADTIVAETAGSERLRIASDGKIGIGINDPERLLHLSSNNTVFALTDTAASTDEKTKYILSDAGVLGIGKLNDAYDTATEYLRIDNSGRLLLGTQTEGHADADDFTIGTSTNSAGITIRTNTSGTGRLWFSDGTSGGAEYEGYVQYDHNNNRLTLGAAQSTRLTINSSGNSQFTGIVTATEFIPTHGQLSHRNIIINGDMAVAQRGNSSNSAGYQTVDRFRTQVQSGTLTQSQSSLSTGGPYSEGHRKFMRILNQSGIGAGASQYAQIDHLVEARNLANSGWNYADSSSNITLSFWVRASVTARYYGWLMTQDGTQRIWSFRISDSSGTADTLTANTWTKITKTFPGNSGITINNDNGKGIQISFAAYYGTNYTESGLSETSWRTLTGGQYAPDYPSTTWATTTNATFDITGVQLEVGSQATPYEFLTRDESLQRCFRYFYRTNRWMGGARGSEVVEVST